MTRRTWTAREFAAIRLTSYRKTLTFLQRYGTRFGARKVAGIWRVPVARYRWWRRVTATTVARVDRALRAVFGPPMRRSVMDATPLLAMFKR